MMKAGTALVVEAAIMLFGAATDTLAQPQMTRLGSPATRFTSPIASGAARQKAFKTKANQAAVGTVVDKAGLASLTPQVLAALTEGKLTEASVEPGTAIHWMALKRGGKPDILLDAAWAGEQPFKAFACTIEDGAKIYNFVVPNACGNLSLVSQTERPVPECIRITMTRNCTTKQVTFTAAGTAISNNQTTVVKVLRDGKQVGELLPGSGFKGTFPLQPGRYTFTATDTYGRAFGTCERDYVVEACAAPERWTSQDDNASVSVASSSGVLGHRDPPQLASQERHCPPCRGGRGARKRAHLREVSEMVLLVGAEGVRVGHPDGTNQVRRHAQSGTRALEHQPACRRHADVSGVPQGAGGHTTRLLSCHRLCRHRPALVPDARAADRAGGRGVACSRFHLASRRRGRDALRAGVSDHNPRLRIHQGFAASRCQIC